jgi:hypothetical protein
MARAKLQQRSGGGLTAPPSSIIAMLKEARNIMIK